MIKPKINHYNTSDGEDLDSVVITLQDMISFKAIHWESSYPKLEIHLNPKQYRELHMKMTQFYTKKMAEGD